MNFNARKMKRNRKERKIEKKPLAQSGIKINNNNVNCNHLKRKEKEIYRFVFCLNGVRSLFAIALAINNNE